jgi:GAF domain-containing protein
LDQNDYPNEGQRIAILQSLGLLSSAREAVFDLIAEAARGATAADGAFVSFVGADLVWFKAAVGQPARRLPRSEAFCDAVVRSGRALVIENVGIEPDYAHVDYAGAYAGAPILLQDHVVGTVCVTSLGPGSSARLSSPSSASWRGSSANAWKRGSRSSFFRSSSTARRTRS